MKIRTNLGWTLLKITVVMILLFEFIPPIFIIGASFSETKYLKFPPKGFTLKWYEAMFARSDLVQSVVLSLEVAFLTVLLNLGLALPAAYVVVRRDFKFRSTINSFIMSPMLVPEVLIGCALLRYFIYIGGSPDVPTLVLGHALVTTPYLFRTVMASFYSLQESIEEAALTLGANRFQTFIRIILPLVRPGLIAGSLFVFLISMDIFGISLLLAPAGTMTLPVNLYWSIQYISDPTVNCAAAIYTVIMLIGAFAIEKIFGLRKFVAQAIGA